MEQLKANPGVERWVYWIVLFLMAFIILGLGMGIGALLRHRAEGVQVFVIGDWGRRGDGQTDTANLMLHLARAHRPDMIVSTGDNFYPTGLRGPKDTENFNKSFREPYADLIDIPWHAVLGNHDYGDGDRPDSADRDCVLYEGTCKRLDTDNPCCYSPLHQLNVRLRTDPQMGDSRWHAHRNTQLVLGNSLVEFFYIDTSPGVKVYMDNATATNNTDDDTRMTPTPRPSSAMPWVSGSGPGGLHEQSWAANLMELESALAASTAKWKIVVGHHPVYTYSFHATDGTTVPSLEAVLRRARVRLYLNGHDHCLQLIEKTGAQGTVKSESIVYATSGAGSKVFKGFPGIKPGQSRPGDAKYLQDKEGMLRVTVPPAEDVLVLEFFTAEGKGHKPDYKHIIKH